MEKQKRTKTIRVSPEVWRQLQIIKLEKNLISINQAIELLLSKYGGERDGEEKKGI